MAWALKGQPNGTANPIDEYVQLSAEKVFSNTTWRLRARFQNNTDKDGTFYICGSGAQHNLTNDFGVYVQHQSSDRVYITCRHSDKKYEVNRNSGDLPTGYNKKWVNEIYVLELVSDGVDLKFYMDGLLFATITYNATFPAITAPNMSVLSRYYNAEAQGYLHYLKVWEGTGPETLEFEFDGDKNGGTGTTVDCLNGITGTLTNYTASDEWISIPNEWGSGNPAFQGYIPSQALSVGDSINLPLASYFNDVTSYAVSSGALPAGLTLNPTTGVISGTATAVTDALNIVIEGAGATTPSAQSNPFNILVDGQSYGVKGSELDAGSLIALACGGTLESNKYYRLETVTAPSSGALEILRGGKAVLVGAADGDHVGTFRIYEDNVALPDFTTTFAVNSAGGNNAPTANAGADQNVTTGNLVTLDGTGSSDPDSDPLTYSWSQTSGTAVTLSSTTAAQPTFTPSVDDTYVFSLVVNDGTVNSAADTVTITSTSASDTTPDAFSFTDQGGVPVSSLRTSNTITVSGINTATTISVTAGQYSINGGAYTSAAGNVNNGDTVTLQLTSSASNSTAVSTTVDIGGVTDIWSVTTIAAGVTLSAIPVNTIVAEELSTIIEG